MSAHGRDDCAYAFRRRTTHQYRSQPKLTITTHPTRSHPRCPVTPSARADPCGAVGGQLEATLLKGSCELLLRTWGEVCGLLLRNRVGLCGGVL